jgi:transcriptional regulator with XRE-family HTH domain
MIATQVQEIGIVSQSPRDRRRLASRKPDQVEEEAGVRQSLMVVPTAAARGVAASRQAGLAVTQPVLPKRTPAMRRAPEIIDFAAKLNLVLDQLNWSRAHLAQRVGVDKSVAQRWATGVITPTEASLTALTDAVRQAVPDFTRADWRLSLEGFARRLGTMPPSPRHADLGSGLFPRATTMVGAAFEALVQRYAGSWLLLHASVQAQGAPEAIGYLASIAPRGNLLWMEVEGSLQGTWRAEGPVFPLHRLVYLMLEDKVHGDSLAFGVLTGVNDGRAMILDGVASSASSSLRGPAAATRMIGLRLGEEPNPAWREAAMRRLVRQNAAGLMARMPSRLADCFRLGPLATPQPMTLAVSAAASLACDETEVALGLAPESADALAYARDLCGV